MLTFLTIVFLLMMKAGFAVRYAVLEREEQAHAAEQAREQAAMNEASAARAMRSASEAPRPENPLVPTFRAAARLARSGARLDSELREKLPAQLLAYLERCTESELGKIASAPDRKLALLIRGLPPLIAGVRGMGRVLGPEAAASCEQQTPRARFEARRPHAGWPLDARAAA